MGTEFWTVGDAVRWIRAFDGNTKPGRANLGVRRVGVLGNTFETARVAFDYMIEDVEDLITERQRNTFTTSNNVVVQIINPFNPIRGTELVGCVLRINPSEKGLDTEVLNAVMMCIGRGLGEN